MLPSGNRVLKLLSIALLALASAMLPSNAQLNRSMVLDPGGAWHLRSRIPLGTEALLLQPSHRVVEMLASAEAPAFAGWTLRVQDKQPVLLDSAGHPVRLLPRVMTFRVTVSARDNFANSEPMPFDCAKNVEEFLLDMHFSVQIFRGMEMRSVKPTRQSMIGVPADESSDERIYRVSFDLGEVRPDERIVLLVTDASGARLTKFHLEFL